MKNLKLLLLSTSILFSSQVFSMNMIYIYFSSDVKQLDRKLIDAIWYNKSLNCIKALIEAGASVNAKDGEGQSALIYAVKRERLEVVKYLIKFGADVNYQNFKLNNVGRTALMGAAATSQPEAVKYLIKVGANVNIKSLCGETALSFAVDLRDKSTQSKVVKYLALAGANLNQIQNNRHRYPTLYQNALNIQNQVKTLFELFRNYKINQNQIKNLIKLLTIQLQLPIKLIRDSNGNTLLHYAAMNEDVQLFGLIYSICPSLISTTNYKNQTPVQLALGSEKIFELIKKLSLQNDNQAKYDDKPKAQPCNLF